MTAEVEAFEGWALVELMGHRKRAGLCKDVAMFGTRLLRVDVPNEFDPKKIVDPEKFTTEFYGGSSIYGLHPCDETTGRRLAMAHTYDRAIEPYQEPSKPEQLSFIDPMDEDDEGVDNERG